MFVVVFRYLAYAAAAGTLVTALTSKARRLLAMRDTYERKLADIITRRMEEALKRNPLVANLNEMKDKLNANLHKKVQKRMQALRRTAKKLAGVDVEVLIGIVHGDVAAIRKWCEANGVEESLCTLFVGSLRKDDTMVREATKDLAGKVGVDEDLLALVMKFGAADSQQKRNTAVKGLMNYVVHKHRKNLGPLKGLAFYLPEVSTPIEC